MSAAPVLEGATRTGMFWMRLNHARDRWHDRSLTVLLATQVIVLFGLVPIHAEGIGVPSSVGALLLLVIMSLVIVMARGHWTLVAGVSTLLFAAATFVARRIWHRATADLAIDAAALATFGVLSIVVLQAVFRPGRVTNHRIRGAVVLYLNLGLMFAFLHRMVAELVPGAYAHIPPPSHPAAFRAALDYFSFATLTSVGYGDIVPVRPIARSLATMEATVGQLLPTVLIARVVAFAVREHE